MIPIAALASAGYFNLVWLLHNQGKNARIPIILVTLVTLAAHSVQVLMRFNGLFNDVSVTNMLTFVALSMATIGAARYFLHHDRIAYTVVAMIAGVCVWFPVLMPAPSSIAHSWGLKVHIVFSISAYIALGFAALYACFLLVQDYRLRRGSSGLNLAIPLNDLEHTMISFTRFGEALLTLSIATGLLFINDIWAQHVVHKLFFSVISWLIIGVLLFRHHLRGFRGRPAALLLLGGFSCLILAYFGTAFVLQFLLNK